MGFITARTQEKKDSETVTFYIYKALQLIIHSELLMELINSTPGVSIKSLTEDCNLSIRELDKSFIGQSRKYAFAPQHKFIEKNLLQQFFSKSSLRQLETAQKENILTHCFCWKYSQGRDKNGVGIGVQMINYPDAQLIFPSKGILKECIERGWVVKSRSKDDIFQVYKLTSKGQKLGKVKAAQSLPIIDSNPFRPTINQS